MIHYVAFLERSDDFVKISLSTMSESGVSSDYETTVESKAGVSDENILRFVLAEWGEINRFKLAGYANARIVEVSSMPSSSKPQVKKIAQAAILLLAAFALGVFAGTYSAKSVAGGEFGKVEERTPTRRSMSQVDKGRWLTKPALSTTDRRVTIFRWAQDREDYRGAAKAIQLIKDLGGRGTPDVAAARNYLNSLDLEQAVLHARAHAENFGVNPEVIEQNLREIIND